MRVTLTSAMKDEVEIFPGPLVRLVRAGYRLRWDGTHGWPHWLRVRVNGLRLAALSGADPAVVELFALFHDARRRNDAVDPGHGARGAALVESLPLADLGLDAGQRALLAYACAHHTDGSTAGDVTVRACWDADRLDLGRVGIRPEPDRLCTDAARDPAVLRWAWERSRGGR
jgi:uncharacterized protein